MSALTILKRYATPSRTAAIWLGLPICLPLAMPAPARAASQDDCMASRRDLKLTISLCRDYIRYMESLGPSQNGPVMDRFRRTTIANAYAQRGFAYGAQNMFAEALGDFTAAVNLAPTDAEYRFNRGYTNEQLGNKEQAVSDYRQALSIKPTLGPALAGYKRLTGQVYAPR